MRKLWDMRTLCNKLGAKRNALVLLGLLIIFVAGLYSVNRFFGRDNETRLIVLSEKRDNGALIASPNTSFRIESVTKQRNTFPIYNFSIADDNTVLLNRMQDSFTGIKLSLLRMNDNEVKDITQNTGYGITITPDRTQAIFTKYGSSEHDYHAYAYDWKSNELKQLGKEQFFNRQFIRNDTYIGFDEKYIKEVQLTTGKEQSIASIEEIRARISKHNGNIKISEDMFLPDHFVIDSNQYQMYFTAYTAQNHVQLYHMPLQANQDNNDDDKMLVDMQQIDQVSLLADGNIILLGEVDNSYGLYLYDKREKQLKLLKKGNILGFDLDAQSSRLAYLQILDNQKGSNELHVTYLKGDAFEADTVIYRNIQDFIKMNWFDNNLFVGGSSMDASELYRFTFKVW